MAIPFVTIKLDKTYQLRFGMRAMVEFEQTSGKKLMELNEEMSVETACQMLWIMLKKDRPELTLMEVCDLVDDYAQNIMDIVDAVTEAVQDAVDGASKNASPTAKKNLRS